MEVLDEKADERFEASCPARLRAFDATATSRSAHLLPKNLTQPKGCEAEEKAFRTWLYGLGERAEPYTLRGP